MVARVIIIFIASLILVWSSKLVVVSFEKLSAKLRIAQLALAGVLIALSTSLPELFVGLVAAIEGKPEISLGNVIGANILNVSLVAGGAALVGGSIAVVGDFIRTEMVVAFLAGL
ncbi:hypothetical protein HY333_00165, partial [Candidatus Collierbacteria bacterium]|nr:hypothetical protein [Candidatus Collierbacteria bacterium]